jgi:hypothetical protein
MKYSRLVWSALALWAIAGTTTLALACDQHKDASAASASNPLMLTAQGGHCSAAQAAACKAAGASAAAMDHCAKGANASAAAMEHCAKGANTSAAAMAHCAKGVSAAAASAALPNCGGQGMTRVAAMSGHADCDACKDMAACEQEILAAGGRSQIVPLKNGVMYVYTAGTAAGIRAVQAAVTHRSERMAAISSSSTADKTHLCSDCKAMRGAIASGKLNREVVSIEGGCLTLVTSNDPAIVARLHAMASAAENHTKS